MKPRRIEGVWWLPQNADHQIPGVFEYDPETGARLTLFGSFDEHGPFPDLLGESPDPAIIHGVGNGKQLTLLNATKIRSSVGMPGIITVTFRSGLVLEGALVPDTQSILFTQLTLEFTYLYDWAQLSGLSLDFAEGFPKPIVRVPQDVVVELPNATLKVTTSPTVHHASREYTISESTQVIIDLAHPMTLDECWKSYIHPIRNFLTLATARPNFPTVVEALLAGEYPDAPKGGHVNVLLRSTNRHDGPKSLSVAEMLFSRPKVGSKLQQVLNNWLRVSTELEPVCDLLFGTEYNQGMYVNQRFLNLVQGLEAYHRRRFPNEVLPAEQHRQRVNEVVSAAPAQHQAWLREALRWSNEPSLKQRLSDLLAKVGASVSALIPDAEHFIRQVRDTRNYLTHFDPGLADKAVQGEELFYLTLKVRYLLIAVLLFDIGFSEEEIKTFLEDNADYSWLCWEVAGFRSSKTG